MVCRARVPRHSLPDVSKRYQLAGHSNARAKVAGTLLKRFFALVSQAVDAQVGESAAAVRDTWLWPSRLAAWVSRLHSWRLMARSQARGRTGTMFPMAHTQMSAGLPGLGAVQVARPRRRVFPGNPDQARHARRFVARALEDCPVVDTAVLLTDELGTNALAHTRSGGGGSFEVIVWRGMSAACVAVLDVVRIGNPLRTAQTPYASQAAGLRW